jgi:hypothetical protein
VRKELEPALRIAVAAALGGNATVDKVQAKVLAIGSAGSSMTLLALTDAQRKVAVHLVGNGLQSGAMKAYVEVEPALRIAVAAALGGNATVDKVQAKVLAIGIAGSSTTFLALTDAQRKVAVHLVGDGFRPGAMKAYVKEHTNLTTAIEQVLGNGAKEESVQYWVRRVGSKRTTVSKVKAYIMS